MKVLSTGGGKVLSWLSKSEVEEAAEKTARNHEGVTQSIILNALSGDDYKKYIGSNPENEGFARSELAESIESSFEDSGIDGELADAEAIAETFLISLEETVIQNEDDHIKIMLYQTLSRVGEDTDKILDQLDELPDLLRGQAAGLESQVPRPRLAGSSKQMDEGKFAKRIDAFEADSEYIDEYFDVQVGFSKTDEVIQVPITQSITLSNDEGVIKDCSVWLDYIVHLEDRWRYDYATMVEGQLLHLQTQLPWDHPVSSKTITIASGESVELQFLGETRDWAVVFPSPEGFPELAYPNLYGSRYPDAKYPSDWWWLIQRDVSPKIRDFGARMGILRVTGSNIEPYFGVLKFYWEDWRNQDAGDDASMEVSIEEVYSPEQEISFDIDVAALNDIEGGLPKNIGNSRGSVECIDTPIRVEGHPDDPLPSEITFSSEIPDSWLAARLSVALADEKTFSFSYEDYVSALVARRIMNREDESSFHNVSELESKIRREDGDLKTPRSWQVSDREMKMPSVEELDDFQNEIKNIRISEEAYQDFVNYTNIHKERSLFNILRLADPQGFCSEEISKINSNLFDRPLYKLSDSGIFFWISPKKATPQISTSVDQLTIEAIISEEEWAGISSAQAIE